MSEKGALAALFGGNPRNPIFAGTDYGAPLINV